MLELSIVKENDSDQILEVYAPYIINTAITFETEVPSYVDFQKRVEGLSSKYPYFVLKDEGKVIGYTYASPFHERAAYKWDVDWSIYLKPEYHGHHLASLLFDVLKESLAMLGYLRIYALVTSANEGSLKMHQKLGFKQIGLWEHTGYKFDKWYDVVLFDYVIKDEEKPLPPKALKDVDFSELILKYNEELRGIKL